MAWTYTPYVWPFVISALIAAGMVGYAWPRRAVHAASAFIILAAVAGVWSLISAVQILSVGREAKVFWADVRYLAITMAPVAWLRFALVYTRREAWTAPRRQALILVMPVVTLAMVLTNAWHGLMFESISYSTEGVIPFTAHMRGPWYWVHVAYSYTLVGVGIVLLVRHRIGIPRLYRRQATMIVWGVLAVMVLNLSFLAAPAAFGHVDLTPIAFTVSAVFFAWALFRYRLLDLMPIARTVVVEDLPDAVVVLDMFGRVLDLNPVARGLFMRREAILLGEPVQALLAPFGLDWRGEALAQEVALGAPPRVQHFDLSITALHDRRDDVIGWVMVLRNVDSHKRAEEALLEAKEAAEAANRAKSEFVANMSHELRTPMNAVIGMTSLLLETPLDRSQHEYVETIRSSGEALLALINDVLDFSKIEAGRLEMEEQPFVLHACIEEALDLGAALATEKGLELVYRIDEAVPPVLVGDVTRLRQVLVNLVGNAVKFTEQGEVVLFVQGAPEGDGYRLRVQVRDTGIGIPEEHLDRLFKSFSQVDASTTRKYGGTGLGLVISKHLIEIMGGSIEVDTEIDAGTAFTFDVLMGTTTDAALAPERPPLWPPACVLLVDKNATFRAFLADLLGRWALSCVAVSSWGEALEQAPGPGTFALALVDARLPAGGEGGPAAAWRARHPEVPVVMLGVRGRLPSGGDTRWITKPVRRQDLYEVLVEVLAPSGAAVPAPPTPAAQPEGVVRPLRILVAEDNPVNQKVALHMLEQMGYRADTVANGVEVLGALERRPYDVIFMDLQMPERNGLDATRDIRRRLPPEQQPYIVALTANAMHEDRQACLDAGMDDYISKPVHIQTLRAALERALARTMPSS